MNKNIKRRRLNHKIRKIKFKHRLNLNGTRSDFTRKNAIELHQHKTIEKLNP